MLDGLNADGGCHVAFARAWSAYHHDVLGVFVVVQNQGQDIDHLAVPALLAQHVILQAAEGVRHLYERCTVAQGAGFALDNSKIMTSIIEHPAWFVVRPLDDAVMGANGLTFGHDNQPIGIDVQADTGVRKAGRYAVAIAFECDQARGRHPFAVFHKPIKGRRQRHERELLSFPHIGDRVGQLPVFCLGPQGDTAIFQPLIELGQILEDRHDLPQAIARILDVLLDLAAVIVARTNGATMACPSQQQSYKTRARTHNGWPWL
mgnify:CR=1 FL=1